MKRKAELRFVPILSGATVVLALVSLVWYSAAMGGIGPRVGSAPADPLSAFSLAQNQVGGQGPSFELTFVVVLLSVMAGYVGGMAATLKLSSAD